jgi:dihydrofolate reductase
MTTAASVGLLISNAEYTDSERSADMGRIVVSEFVSLDGVIEAPGGGEDYRHGGWSFEIDRGPEGDRFKLDETIESEALLLGRVTYEGFAAAWPTMEGEFADKLNSMPKYVISSTLEQPEWNNTTVLGGDLVDEVSKLRESVSGDVVVHGSARLVQGLLEHDLVDELRLMVYPVVLGSGKRLFGKTTDKKRVRLTATQVVGDGIVIHTYEAVREGAA